jgi:hypothetical protein
MAAEGPRYPRPRGLKTRGRRFWDLVLDRWELTASERELLCECCGLLDEIEDLRRAIGRDGATVLGSAGQPVTHPAFRELRQTRLALARLLAQLALPEDDGTSLSSPASSKARRAAETRWKPHNQAKAAQRG